jgi:hypothetical protein
VCFTGPRGCPCCGTRIGLTCVCWKNKNKNNTIRTDKPILRASWLYLVIDSPVGPFSLSSCVLAIDHHCTGLRGSGGTHTARRSTLVCVLARSQVYGGVWHMDTRGVVCFWASGEYWCTSPKTAVHWARLIKSKGLIVFTAMTSPESSRRDLSIEHNFIFPDLGPPCRRHPRCSVLRYT